MLENLTYGNYPIITILPKKSKTETFIAAGFKPQNVVSKWILQHGVLQKEYVTKENTAYIGTSNEYVDDNMYNRKRLAQDYLCSKGSYTKS